MNVQHQMRASRREFLGIACAAPLAFCRIQLEVVRRISFSTRGGGPKKEERKRATINSDGTGLELPKVIALPNETGIVPCGTLTDGRTLVWSIEKHKDWQSETLPFNQWYHKSRTRIRFYDHATGEFGEEVLTKERLAPMYNVMAIIPPDDRALVSAIVDGQSQVFWMDLDGRNAKAVTKPNEFVYGLSFNPDKTRMAFHANYRICTMNIDGSERKEIAGRDNFIFFGTSWSPDGEWVLFQGSDEPAHDWSDLYVARPDGTELRQMTEGYPVWWGTSHGAPNCPGGGSNMPVFTPDGKGIVYSRRLPKTTVPWAWQKDKLDTDHFNRIFSPDDARGGTHIHILDVNSKKSELITEGKEQQWEMRGSVSPDGKQVVFCRSTTGTNPAVWVIDRDGSNAHLVTEGFDGTGADFPTWVAEREPASTT